MKFYISILLFFFASSTAFASDGIALDDSAVQEMENFQELSILMKQNSMGLVMMLHAENCSYCELMDQRILSPMERSGEYKERVFIRKLQIDKPEFVTDFKGNRVIASSMANAYDSRLTPTLVFLDYTGEEQVVKIIGINSVEMFSASVDEQIDELTAFIKSN